MKPTAALFIVLSVTGCSSVQSPLNPAGDQAATLHGLMNLMLTVCGIAYLLVMVFLAWAVWRGRRRLVIERPRDERGLQRGLIVWTALIVLGLSVMTGASFLVDRALAKAPTGPATIRVTGHQWWWRVQYWDAAQSRWIETANELHLPIDKPQQVEVVSSDVIHSFWIPSLSGKLDMVPGRVNRLTLTPRRLGWFRGQCGEFCGLQHTEMALDVKVESPADFAAWLEAQSIPASSPAPGTEDGHDIFTGGPCANCHTVRGVTEKGRAGPDLTHIGGRRFLAAGTLPLSHANLMGWIAQPQAHKPGAEMPATGLAPQDVDAVARYLEGLK